MAVEALRELERDAVMGTYLRAPVEFVRGEGARLWDVDGNEYLDFLVGISVSLLGHCHPGVVGAIREQCGRLIHVSNLFYTEPAMRLAARLSTLSLGGKVFFTNSGAEAVECALKLARKRRPGGGFVVLDRAFHGRTMGALSATPQEAKQAPFAPLVPGFAAVAPDDPEALATVVDDHTAAVIVEAVQGEGGIHTLESGLLAAAREACDRHGALLICDEVQCGLGRTGARWGYELAGITPDVITLAKGLGGGLPIGACVATPEHSDVLVPGDHGSTFAGAPVVAAAANAVLDEVERDELLASVRARGERLRTGLEALGLDVRGVGLMLAFAIEDAPALVSRALTEQRLVLNATGPDTVRLLPPLNVGDAEIDAAVDRIAALVG